MNFKKNCIKAQNKMLGHTNCQGKAVYGYRAECCIGKGKVTIANVNYI